MLKARYLILTGNPPAIRVSRTCIDLTRLAMVAEAKVGSEESVSVIIDPADPPAILAARSPILAPRSPILAGAETRDGTEITDADVP